MLSYAQLLRAIGQARELLHVNRFDSELDGAVFIVRGQLITGKRDVNVQAAQEIALRQIRGLIPGCSTTEIKDLLNNLPQGFVLQD